MSEATPKTLGRYEIEAEIGRGMMGIVYRAHDPALGRIVALKTVRLAFSIPEAERELFEKRFLTEARVAAGLSHPGIVVVHDVGRDSEAGTLYIALEYLQGRTLAQMTEDGRPLEWREALRLTARIGEALAHAHAQGIVHRDVKPANVMVLPSGEPKIMDFGIAKVPASQLTSAGEFFGTPSYMSPEQASGESLDGRSDLFSLGAVLYFLLTGRRAFDAPNVPAILARVTHQDPPLPASVVPGLPRDVDYLVARTLAKNPADRYADGQALAEDVEDILGGRTPRHRAGWREPERVEGTWVSVTPVERTETADLRARGSGAGRTSGTAARTAPPPGDSEDVLLRLVDRLGTRGLVLVGGLAVASVVLALLLPRQPAPVAAPATEGGSGEARPASAEPSPEESRPIFRLPFGRPAAQLEVAFEHSLKKGTLRVYVDDDMVMEEPLESRVTSKIITFKKRKGSAKEVVEVPPGEHVVRVEVVEDGDTWSKRIRGTFESGETRRLGAKLGGLLKKDLSLWWGS